MSSWTGLDIQPLLSPLAWQRAECETWRAPSQHNVVVDALAEVCIGPTDLDLQLDYLEFWNRHLAWCEAAGPEFMPAPRPQPPPDQGAERPVPVEVARHFGRDHVSRPAPLTVARHPAELLCLGLGAALTMGWAWILVTAVRVTCHLLIGVLR